jgi:uncharacterized phage protein gp47/JayE
LTDRGFRRPDYVELLDAFEYQARALFGPKANLTVRSPLGMFLRIFAWFASVAFQVLENIYNSRFVDTAVGTSLYNIGRMIGLRLLSAERAVGYLQFTGVPNTVIPKGYLACTIENWMVATLDYAVIDKNGLAIVAAQAQLPGSEGNVKAHTLNIIVNPGIPEGIDAVTNPKRFAGGRNRETDEEFRDRYYKSVDFAGGVNADAIAAEILQNAEGVLAAIVFENDTDETDDNGLPPHSIEAIVYGGLDEDVGKQIYRRKAAGIQTYGNVETSVTGLNGLIYTILFSRPAPKPVWFKVWGLKIDPMHFPPNGMERIKYALSAYVGGTGSGGLGIGEPVYYKHLPAVVYSVPGVINFELTMSNDGTTFNYQDVAVDLRQKAVCDMDKVLIVV